MALTRPYANFSDPVGLVLRMLRSRDPAARSALLRAAAEVAMAPLDWAMSGVEASRQAYDDELLPIVLIVGLPRSGTTVVYQRLAACLPFSYFDNWSALFPRSTITGSALRGPERRRADHAVRSYYGNTPGPDGVNDAFHVWNRWLGDDRYAVPEVLDAAVREDMRRFFAAWFRLHRRPLLNKNNRNSLCIDVLAAALPTAYVVTVRRNPVFVAQSLLKAREVVQGDRRRGWGLGAHDGGYPRDADPLVDVANQVRYCERELERHLGRIPAGRRMEIAYEDFCADPVRPVLAVWERLCGDWPALRGLGAPRTMALGRMTQSDRAELPAHEFERLRRLLGAA
jgi:hypothetical protein